MRRLRDLATMNVASAVAGATLALLIVFTWREHGVAAALVAMTTVSLIAAVWFARDPGMPTVVFQAGDFSRESMALLQFGVVFMGSAVMMTGRRI